MRFNRWFLLVCLTHTAQADISINNVPLPMDADRTFHITQELGQTVGNNLFHSFDTFNLPSGEIAHFSGSNQIHNIISRVTGGTPSFINGTIRSTIPNADFYFLNPYGIIFGEHAQLDLQGSFHASTADYLKLSDDGEFHARFPEQDILTTAPIASFGFLTDVPASINFQGSKLVVLPKKDISVIAGNITMEQARLFATDNKQQKAGEIRITSVASQGEVSLSNLDMHSFESLGNITMIGDGTNKGDGVLSVKGSEAGFIQIRGANMLLSNRGFLEAHAYGQQGEVGKGIDIKLTGQLKLTKAADIASKAFSPIQTAPIFIEADSIELLGGSQITSNIWDAGQGNILQIKANNILFSGVSEQVLSSKGGLVGKNPSGIFSISHTTNPNAVESNIVVEASQLTMEHQGQINVVSTSLGNAGSIKLDVEQLNMKADGSILSTTLGLGDGGAIHIDAKQIEMARTSTINSSGFGPGEGKAGDITINAQNFTLLSGSNVNISTVGLGQSGAIAINVTDTLSLSGQSPAEDVIYYDFVNMQLGGNLARLGVKPTDVIGASKINASVINLGPETAGNIQIQAGHIDILNGAEITGEHRGLGNAGEVAIKTNSMHLNHGKITTETFGGGGGGNIQLDIANIIHLTDSSITTSVGTGLGQGGDIIVNEPLFTVLNRSQIVAQADEGNGGNIRIVADQFLKSPLSLVSASSRLGIDGNIEITSPDETISDSLLSLSKEFLIKTELSDPCKHADYKRLMPNFKPDLSLKANMYPNFNNVVEDWLPSSATILGSTTYR